jgi:hypothetical protein
MKDGRTDEKWGYQQYLFVCSSIKRVAKRWINPWQEKKVVRASDFPFSEYFQNVVRRGQYILKRTRVRGTRAVRGTPGNTL